MKIDGTSCEKEFQKTNQAEFKVEKIIKRKGDKLSVKQKDYDNSSITWLNKKDMVQPPYKNQGVFS